MKERLLIVGAGMATAYLLQALEEHPHDLEVTVIGEERERCYNRVLLSNVLSGEKPEADLRMLDDGGAPSVTFITNTRIDQIETGEKLAHSQSGQSFPFDKLVFATGACVARPALGCQGIAGVGVFRTLQDTRYLRNLDARGQAAVVVGGGLLGLEAAHGLNELGFTTTVLHRNDVLMNRQLDAPGGRQLQLALERRGIDFRLGTSISDLVVDSASVAGVVLESGEILDCDLLLFATGIVPNAALASGSEICTERGILVDERLRTSRDGFFALGECSQFGSQCFGLVAPIRDQAAVLARELCGKEGPAFAVADWPTQLKISGIDIYRTGELDDAAEQLVLQDAGRGVYRRLVIRDDRLIGAVLVGDKRGGTWYAELVREHRNVERIRRQLMFGREVSEALLAAA